MGKDECENGATCEVSYILCTHSENDATLWLAISALAISAQNTVGSYTCKCTEYYIGDYCEEDKDECKDVDFCQYQGNCTVSSYRQL